MSSLSDRTLRDIGEAALELFARHGFQRTSMAEIARHARISRATLYLRFKDKTALFEHLAQRVADDALAAAAAAWDPARGLAANIEAALLAKDLPLYRLLHASPHGAELLAVDARVTQAHALRLDTGFAEILAARASMLETADLAAFEGPEGFGRFIAITGAGLKHETHAEPDYLAAVRRLAEIAARAAEPRETNR